jgi:hypothetical protein
VYSVGLLAAKTEIQVQSSGTRVLRSPKWRTFLLGLLLITATVAVYYPVSGHPFFSLDDRGYVVENPYVRSGLSWDTVQWAFTSYDQGNWHPLTWLSHALDYQMFHLNPRGHHDTNILLHALNAAMLFWVLSVATGYTGRSFMVAALFALHPVNVESVAWIAERKNVLSMLFFLLALGAYRWYAREPRVIRYVLVTVLYALGLMAKPQVITLPFVLLLWDYWPLQRMFGPSQDSNSGMALIPAKSHSWLVVEKLPLLALATADAFITVSAQRSAGAMMDTFPFHIRVGNAIVSYARYVGKALWPSNLAVFYPDARVSLRTWQVWVASLLLVAVTGLVIKAHVHRYVLVGWLWFLGTLVPMIGIVQVGQQAMADRYAYLPFLGLFIAICWGMAEWADRERVTNALVALSTVVLMGLTMVAHRQINYWNDNWTLWSHTLEVTRGNWGVEDFMGTELLAEGNAREAMPHFFRAAATFPPDPISNLHIGEYEQRRGDMPKAIEHYKRVVGDPRNNPVLRVQAFDGLGTAYSDLKEDVRSREAFQAAANLNPKDALAWSGLGVAAQRTGELDLAIQAYTRSLEIAPSDIGYLMLARAWKQNGNYDQAERAIQQATRLSQNLDEARRVSDRLLAP